VPIVTCRTSRGRWTGLNERGFMTVGLDSAGKRKTCPRSRSRKPLALGARRRGQGLAATDAGDLQRGGALDMPGEIKSLNVSNAAVLALYVGATRLGLMK